jgi:hypothetical protein
MPGMSFGLAIPLAGEAMADSTICRKKGHPFGQGLRGGSNRSSVHNLEFRWYAFLNPVHGRHML